jgi:C4-dicarboxylate-specific signal transduction histidine kinase
VSRHYIAGPTVDADAAQLRQVLTGLLDVALDTLGPVVEGRRIDLFLDNGDGRATIRLRDNAAGVASLAGVPDARAKRIVEAHHGSIDVASPVEGGTEFRITLPLPG